MTGARAKTGTNVSEKLRVVLLFLVVNASGGKERLYSALGPVQHTNCGLEGSENNDRGKKTKTKTRIRECKS